MRGKRAWADSVCSAKLSFPGASLRAVLDAHTPAGATGLVVALSGGADSAGFLAAASALGSSFRGPRGRAVHGGPGFPAAAPPFRGAPAALCRRPPHPPPPLPR